MKSQLLRASLWLILWLLPMFALSCGVIKPKEIQTQIFRPIEDTMALSIQPDQTYGNTDYLYVGSGNTGIKKTYLLFDVSSIPSGSKVILAHLLLYYDHQVPPSNSVTISAHKVTSLWDQANLTWNNEPTSDPTIVAQNPIPTAANKEKDWRKWFIGELVQGWIDHTINNYGVLLKSTSVSTNSTYKGFRSSDNTEYSNQWPILEVLYTNP